MPHHSIFGTIKKKNLQIYEFFFTISKPHLEVLVHQFKGCLCVGGTQEAVDQSCPAQGELKLYVFLEVTAECGTVQVIAQIKLPAGHEHVDLALDSRGK